MIILFIKDAMLVVKAIAPLEEWKVYSSAMAFA